MVLERNGSGPLSYKPGYHITIFPSNSSAIVDPLFTLLTQRNEELLTAQVNDTRFPNFNLKEALYYFLDITRPLEQKALAEIAKSASNEQQRLELEILAQVCS